MSPESAGFDRWSYYLLACLALVLIFSTALAEVVAVLLIFLWILRLLIFRYFDRKDYFLFIPLILWLVLRIISIILSTAPELSYEGWEKVWIPLLFFPIAAILLTEERKKLFLLLLLVSSILAASWGSYKVIAGIQLRAASTSGGYYTLGVQLCVALALLLAYIAEKTETKLAFLLYLPGFLLVVGIFFTYTRACYLAAVFTILILTFLRQKKIILFLVPLVLLYFWGPQGKFERSNSLGSPDFATGRFQIWQAGLSRVPETPFFGFGVNTFQKVYPPELRSELGDQKVDSWHNDFLQIYLESGPITLIAYLAILLLSVKRAWMSYRANDGPVSASLHLGSLLLVLNWVIIGLFANLNGDPLNWILFWTISGVAVADKNNS